MSATATDFIWQHLRIFRIQPDSGYARRWSCSTSEGGVQATFSVVLAIQPTADVTVALRSSDTTEGTVSPAALTFTPGNWNVPQVATVSGVDDTVADGLVSYTIVTEPAMSADSRFEGYDPDDVQVLNYDNEFASQTAIQPQGSLIYNSTLEGVIDAPGHTESYSLLLDPGQTLSVLVESSGTCVRRFRSLIRRAHWSVRRLPPLRAPTRWCRPSGFPARSPVTAVPRQPTASSSGVDGTTGIFTVSTYLNTALETELHNGPANNAMASAQNLEGSFVSLHNANNNGNSAQPSAARVLGEITVDAPDTADWYRFDLKSGQARPWH